MSERVIDYAQLDVFLNAVDEVTQTTRRSSEDFYDCPPVSVIVPGERQTRALIDNTYGAFARGETAPEAFCSPEAGAAFIEGVKRQYWEPVTRLKEQVVAFGASDEETIDAYFKVDQCRHESAIRASIREKYEVGSPAIHLLNSVEAYSAALGIDIMTAARITVTHLQIALPHMKRRVTALIEQGVPDVVASRRAFGEFAEELVPRHTENARQLIASGRTTHSLVNKPSFYPGGSHAANETEEPTPPLRLTMEDAKGVMAVYPLEKMPYTLEELRLGDQIIRDPRMQTTLLLFQMAAVDYMKQYLVEHPERMQSRDRLLPFTEFFVVEHDNDDPNNALAPNPKLMQVLSNNFVPALAGVMLREGVTLDTITAEQLARSAEEAKRRRIFQLQIGKFNGYDETANTVALDAIINRTCPAMQTLTSALEQWLPRIYQHCCEQINA